MAENQATLKGKLKFTGTIRECKMKCVSYR